LLAAGDLLKIRACGCLGWTCKRLVGRFLTPSFPSASGRSAGSSFRWYWLLVDNYPLPEYFPDVTGAFSFLQPVEYFPQVRHSEYPFKAQFVCVLEG
jgi:hypothetical protein